MKVLWCDTETTGIKPEDSGAFQIAMLYKHGADKRKVWKRLFFLNPIDEEKGILCHESAAQVHGCTKEQIEAFGKAENVMPKIAEFLNLYCRNFSEDGEFEKLYFAGYKCSFDWSHLDALFERYTNYRMTDFFETKTLDVFDQVKRATDMGVINTANQKLGTVCKSLNVPLKNAHDAMGDIMATRNLGIALQRKGVPLVM